MNSPCLCALRAPVRVFILLPSPLIRLYIRREATQYGPTICGGAAPLPDTGAGGEVPVAVRDGAPVVARCPEGLEDGVLAARRCRCYRGFAVFAGKDSVGRGGSIGGEDVVVVGGHRNPAGAGGPPIVV